MKPEISPLAPLFLGLVVAQAAAQAPAARPPVVEIPEVIVVAPAEGNGKDILRTPLENLGGRDVLGPREVAEAGTINVQELFRRTPGVFISEESGSDSLPNIGMRGVAGNDGVFRSINVAMLADGIPLAPAPYAQPGASLFPFTLERLYAVDVQKGGASVRYGPNNVTGIINYLTRPIPERSTVELLARWNNFDDRSSYLGAGGRYGRLGAWVEAVYKEGDTFRDNGDYRIENYALKTSFDYNESSRGMFQVEYYNEDTRLSDGLSLAQFQADPRQSTSPFNRYHGDQRRFNYKHEWDLSERTKFEFISYYYEGIRSFYLQSPIQSGPAASFVQGTPRPMEVWALQPQVSHEFELGSWDSKLVVGARYHDENFTRIVERFFPDGSYELRSRDRFDYTATTLFIEDTFTKGRWSVRPGVRLEQIEIDAQDRAGLAVAQDSNEVLPAVSASYLVSDSVSIFANAQTSYQPPASNIIELSSDPQDIASQRARVYELGARFEALDGRQRFDLTGYLIDYKDRFEPDPDQFDVFVNTGRSRHMGVEFTVDQDLSRELWPGMSTWASISYNDSEYTNGEFDGNNVPGAPPWLLAGGLRYEHDDTGLYAAVDAFYVDEAYSDRENTTAINASGTRGQKPSHTVWNANVGWRRAISEGVQLHLQGIARNVFDEEYFDVRSGRGIYLGAPFGFGFSIGLRFTL